MSLPLDQLTIKARDAVLRAQQTAQEQQHQFVAPLHLLAAFFDEPRGILAMLFERIGVDTHSLKTLVDGELDRLPRVTGDAGELGVSPELEAVLSSANQRAQAMGDRFLSTEHLLLGLLDCDNTAGRLLKLSAVEEHDVLEALESIRGTQQVTDDTPETDNLMWVRVPTPVTARGELETLIPAVGPASVERDLVCECVLSQEARMGKRFPISHRVIV